MQSSICYDLSSGKEVLPVLCDDPRIAASFVYVKSCPDPDMEQGVGGDHYHDACSCVNGCSDIDVCPCKMLLPGTSVNMRECGSGCACWGERCCQVSPVSRGLNCRLLVSASGAKGSGVFALENIATGRFVCEYAGQRISLDDAIRRTCKKIAGSGARAPDMEHNYILVFKEHFSDGRLVCTCLDPTRIGNVGRFINHSCGPNLDAFAIRICGYQYPRVAFFAARDINIGDELTFSYQDSTSLQDDGSDCKPCFCGHTNCKKWLPYEPV